MPGNHDESMKFKQIIGIMGLIFINPAGRALKGLNLCFNIMNVKLCYFSNMLDFHP